MALSLRPVCRASDGMSLSSHRDLMLDSRLNWRGDRTARTRFHRLGPDLGAAWLFGQRLKEFLAWCRVWMVVSPPLRHEDRRHEDGPTQLQPHLSPSPPLAQGSRVCGQNS